MRPEQVRSARQAAGSHTAAGSQAARISQAYLALLEGGHRPVTAKLASGSRSCTALARPPCRLDSERVDPRNSASLAAQLAALGYPGFRHLARRHKKNPAAVLLAAILAEDIEVRVIEALPWLVAEYSDLDWEWVIREAKLRDAQNRLGFLVTLARQVAEKRGNNEAANRLGRVGKGWTGRAWFARTPYARPRSPTLSAAGFARVRPPAAHYWNLLTDLDTHPCP